ncbi:MAG TPA: hypothetical protein VGU69_10425 [Rhizomicrobium sp.]|nr:hypothetical protein [Rhizomicrobium sp.]
MMRRHLSLLALTTLMGGCSIVDQWTAKPLPPAPLEQISAVDFLTRLPVPPDNQTVAEAANYLLAPTKYHLLLGGPFCPPEAPDIAAKPISPLGLKPAITTIKRALILVAGSKTRLLIDEDAKSVTFAYVSDPE